VFLVRNKLDFYIDIIYTRVRFRVRVTLRLAVYRQSVPLGAKPLENHGQYFFSTEHLRLQSLCNIRSDERMRLSFTIAAGPRQCSHSRIRVPRDSWPYFTVTDSRPPNLEGQVPVFISPRNRVALLYPQALGSSIVVCVAVAVVTWRLPTVA
jgi:hypothetical protein